MNAAVRQAVRALRGALAVCTATAIVVNLVHAWRSPGSSYVAYSLGDRHQPAPEAG
jgi:hypothetical protein